MSFTPFENESLRFRPFEEEDLPVLKEYINHPILLGRRNVPWGIPEYLPLSTVQIEEIKKKWISRKRGFVFLVEEKESKEIVGHIDCSWNWDTLQPSIALTIVPNHQRKSYGSQVLKMGLNYLFSNLPAISVSCWIPDWNEIGLKFIEKHEWVSCGRMRRAGIFQGKFYDFLIYNILREEWMVRK
jgi:RimJ/RimL family protein N-acetyltransferase